MFINTIPHLLTSSPPDRPFTNPSDRKASAQTIVIKSRQYKDFVNVYKLTFTFPAQWVLDRAGNWLVRFLAPPIAHRGYEGSDIRVRQNTPKDLDTIAACAQAKAAIAKTIKRKMIALLSPCAERTQLFSNSLLTSKPRSPCLRAGESYATTVMLCEGYPLCLDLL
jgi:hypothetical protein